MRQFLEVSVIACLLFVAPASIARAVDFETTETRVPMLGLDLAVPESPAFTALGLNPENVTRPGTPREFATALLSGLDRNGNFQTGLAIDVSPYMMTAGDSLTIHEYRESYIRRFAARFQTSLATVKGTSSDDDALRLGVGFRATPWDRGDPRLSKALEQCLMGDDMGIPVATDYESRDAWLKAVDERFEQVQARADKCLEQSEKRLWNASAWDIGAAPTWIQEGGGGDDVSWGGATVWTSLAYGFDGRDDGEQPSWFSESSELIAHVRYRLGEEEADSSGTFHEQDSLTAGLRFRAGRPDLSFSVETSYLYEDPDSGAAEDSFQGALNSDIKIADQIWLLLGLGITAGDESKVMASASLKWGGREVDLAALAASIAPGIADAAGATP